jgi:hypothetical protein
MDEPKRAPGQQEPDWLALHVIPIDRDLGFWHLGTILNRTRTVCGVRLDVHIIERRPIRSVDDVNCGRCKRTVHYRIFAAELGRAT